MPRTRTGTAALPVVVAGLVLGIAVTLSGIAGCRDKAAFTTPPVPSVATPGPESSVRPPPIDAFQMMLQLPPAPGKPAAVPPESVLRPFRVWINQETPRQKKTPEWRSFPAKDGLTLELAPDGKWRCLINPVRIVGKVGEGAGLAAWQISRTVRCSNDGWMTYVEEQVRGEYTAEGKKSAMGAPAAMSLNDVVNGQPRTTVVVLEAEDESRPE